MGKNDYFGLGVSMVLHLCLLLIFSIMTAASPSAQLGFMEVELGPTSFGQPVARSAEPERENIQAEQPTPPEQEPQPETTPTPEEARDVDLPEQLDPLPTEDVVHTPETETISPETRDAPEVEQPRPRQEEEIQPLGGGSTQGSTGASEGDDGPGTDDVRQAPYSLEGIDRTPVRAPLPQYTEKVNAVIRVRITVDPSGRVVRSMPERKSNPALEQAVMDALRSWQFNTLARNVPQENQTGIVTFRFRLE